MFRTIVRCSLFCSAGGIVSLFIVSSLGTYAGPSQIVSPVPYFVSEAYTPMAYSGPGLYASSFRSVLFTPLFSHYHNGSWLNPMISPFRQFAYVVLDVLSIPIVFFAICGGVMFSMLSRTSPRKHKTSEPEPLQTVPEAKILKMRRQTETIQRMHGVMDRIEIRVERLESALLP